MAVKPVAYPDPGTSGASLDQPGSAGFFEPLVRGLAGDGALNLVRAKGEVRAALRAGGGLVPPAPLLEDALEPGTPIYIEDLEAWEKKAGVKVGSGDVMIIRTGRWARHAAAAPRVLTLLSLE